jgi:hypothetical protein
MIAGIIPWSYNIQELAVCRPDFSKCIFANPVSGQQLVQFFAGLIGGTGGIIG